MLAATCDTGSAIALAVTPAGLAAVMGILAGWKVHTWRGETSQSDGQSSQPGDGDQDSAG
jgi:hypothetical protein